MKKVLVVAVHPDDETLMCGGALLKHKEQGDEIYWLIITNIIEKFGFPKDYVNQKQIVIEQVKERYGFNELFKLDYPTARLDEIPLNDLINSISAVINKVKPNIIYLPNRSDVHTDHQISFKAAYSCTKNFRYPFIEKILMGETISETEFAYASNETVFSPNYFVDISEYFEKKIEAMSLFSTQVMEGHFPRSISSIEALCRFRGSRIGVKYAEAFVLLLNIE